MGLLDEAIRDHLELKRRRGADPSEIARAEQEALEPVFPPEEDGHAPLAEPLHGDEDGYAPAPDATEASAPADHAMLGQDTAEIDMEAVLQEADAVEPGAAEPAAETEPLMAPEEELLEWETPTRAVPQEPAAEGLVLDAAPHDGARDLAPPHAADPLAPGAPDGPDLQIPGQERISFE